MTWQHAVGCALGTCGLLFATPVFAAKVIKADGRKAMLELEGDPAKVGDIYVVYDPAGKRRGVIKVSAIKGTKAVGLLGKGKAQVGWQAKISDRAKAKVSPKTQAARQQTQPANQPTDSAGNENRSAWGIMVGASMDTMSVDIDNSGDNVSDETVSLDGMAFNGKLLFDYNLFPQVWFRGLGGIEGLSAKGPSRTGCQAKTCDVSIYYMAFDFWARYVFGSGSFRPWIGAAFSLMFPVTKSATALEDSSITNTSMMSVGAGFDWYTSPSFYIPLQIEYNMLPKSETVEVTAITGRLGFAIPF